LHSNPSYVLQKIRKLIRPYILKNFENFKDRLKDIDAIIQLSSEYKTISAFLDDLNLNMSELSSTIKESASNEKQTNRVVLSTIHKAKGLEWKVVFIISLSEHLFPPSHNRENELDIEEERRIFYVALTRAKDDLFLISPKSANSYKKTVFLQPSRFVNELDSSLYEVIDYSINLVEDFNFKSSNTSFKKNNSENQKRHFSSEFTTADKLLKGKD
jgi:DNA helicase-2/ATP-dependent DNA helicase PcrA